jgi:hypothetical protein
MVTGQHEPDRERVARTHALTSCETTFVVGQGHARMHIGYL